MSGKEQTQIPTNLRIIVMLEAISRKHRGASLTQLCSSLKLPRATVHRLLQTAIKEQFVQQGLDGLYHATGQRLHQLAKCTLSTAHLRNERLVVLKSVATKLGETCNIAIPSGEGMIYFDRVETDWPLRIHIPIGSQVPFHCTAAGKLFLSTLPSGSLDAVISSISLEPNTRNTLTSRATLVPEIERIRERGYSIDNEEFIENMTAIAVPIVGQQGRFLASLSVHAPVQRIAATELTKCLPALRDAVKKLAAINLD